jgi:hypothetical protein
MSTVLRFRALPRVGGQRRATAADECEIVIFPGVRMERHDSAALDLAHRVYVPADDDYGGKPRPRRTN